MNIAVFSDYRLESLGGIQTSLRAQCDELHRQGHTVIIVCPRDVKHASSALPYSFVEVPALPIKLTGYEFVYPTKRMIENVTKTLRFQNIDIIHAHTNMGIGIMALTVSRELGLPLVQTFHGREDVLAELARPLPIPRAWVMSRLHRHFVPHEDYIGSADDSYPARQAWTIMLSHARAADYVTAPTRHFLQLFLDRGMETSSQAISNGLSNSVVDALPSRQHFSPELSSVVWIGRLWPEKNPSLVVETAKLLPSVQFTMYGNGILYDELHRTAPSNLTIITTADQMACLQAMQHADALLHTSSNFESQSMVLLETIATSTPTVMVDEKLFESVPDDGALLAESNAHSLAAALRQLDVGRRALMASAMYDARDRITQSYLTKQMLTVYNEAIDRHARGR